MASVGSLVLSVVIARNVGAADYGLFALVFATCSIAIGIVRALTAEVLMFTSSLVSEGEFKARMSSATSASLALSICAAIVVAVVAFAFGDAAHPFILLALGLPGLIAQDHFRFVFVAAGRAKTALLVDTIFVLVLLVLLLMQTNGSLSSLIGGWIGATYVTALIGFVMLKPRVSLRGAFEWMRTEWPAGRYFLGDFLATNALALGSIFLIGALASVSDAGAVRAAQVLLTPILLVTRGLTIALSPEAKKLVDRGRYRALVWTSFGFSVVAASAVGAALLLVLLLPPEVFESILGESSAGALALFPFAALATGLLALAMGPGLGLRAAGLVNRAFRSKIISTPFALTGVVVGTVLGGAAGSQLGLALGELVRGFGNWIELARWKKSTQPDERA